MNKFGIDVETVHKDRVIELLKRSSKIKKCWDGGNYNGKNLYGKVYVDTNLDINQLDDLMEPFSSRYIGIWNR